MPNIALDLILDRVDLVDEGANSEAYIRIFKRKESALLMDFEAIISKLRPEYASVIQEAVTKAKADGKAEAEEAKAKLQEDLTNVTEELVKARGELSEAILASEEAGKKLEELSKSKGNGTDEPDMEEVLKSLDPAVQKYFGDLRKQKEMAEEAVRLSNEQKVEENALAKARELKSLPIEESALKDIVKSASQDALDLLINTNKLIQDGKLLDEFGKNRSDEQDAWGKIEKKAQVIASERQITVEEATKCVIKEFPQLYRDYLERSDK